MNQERVDSYLEKYKMTKEKVEIKEVENDDDEEEGDNVVDEVIEGCDEMNSEEENASFDATSTPFANILPDL